MVAVKCPKKYETTVACHRIRFLTDSYFNQHFALQTYQVVLYMNYAKAKTDVLMNQTSL